MHSSSVIISVILVFRDILIIRPLSPRRASDTLAILRAQTMERLHPVIGVCAGLTHFGTDALEVLEVTIRPFFLRRQSPLDLAKRFLTLALDFADLE